MKKQFRSSWDFLLIIMTVAISILLIGMAFFTGSVITSIISVSVITIGVVFGVYGYSIQDHELRIIRLGWSKDIPYSDIAEVEYSPDVMMGSLRTFGIGGFFSYYGLFRNRILGSYKAYATHRKNTVIITTRSGNKILVTPNEPARFAEELKKVLESA
jgi:hypothetical protein